MNKQGQHYLSQKHLSYWSDDGRNVYRYDLNSSEAKHLPISSVAKKNNQWAKEVENPIFSNFEGKYAKIIKQLEAREAIAGEIEHFLKELRIVLFSRVPKQRRDGNRLTDDLFGFFSRKPTINDYTRTMITEMRLHSLFLKKTQPFVVIIIAPGNKTFVITDNPTAACLPLTPKMCLLTPSIKEFGTTNRYVNINENLVKKINEENIKRTDSYIFSLEAEHPDIIDYLKRRG